MLASINSFSPTEEVADHGDFQNYTVNFLRDQSSSQTWSILYRKQDILDGGSPNANIFRTLIEIEGLEDNWDGEGSISPNDSVIQSIKGLIIFLDAIGQNIYAIAPGPQGEIMMDLRFETKSLEILVYPDRMKYIKFSTSEKPLQGVFTPDILLNELIAWLNSNDK